MWKSDFFLDSINEYIKSIFVDEIIIINNNKKFIYPRVFNHEKIKMIRNKENIYVNPSWNLGANISKNENLIFANDDIKISKLDKVLKELSQTNLDLVGLDLEGSILSDKINIRKISNKIERPYGFGCWFYLKKTKYVHIPEDIKIWCGDNIQFYSNLNKGLIKIPNLEYEVSKTVKSIEDYRNIVYNNDRPKYFEFCKLNGIEIIS